MSIAYIYIYMDAPWTIGINASIGVSFLNFSPITITNFVVDPFGC